MVGCENNIITDTDQVFAAHRIDYWQCPPGANGPHVYIFYENPVFDPILYEVMVFDICPVDGDGE